MLLRIINQFLIGSVVAGGEVRAPHQSMRTEGIDQLAKKFHARSDSILRRPRDRPRRELAVEIPKSRQLEEHLFIGEIRAVLESRKSKMIQRDAKSFEAFQYAPQPLNLSKVCEDADRDLKIRSATP